MNQSQMKRFKRALKKFDLENFYRINYYVNLGRSSSIQTKNQKLFSRRDPLWRNRDSNGSITNSLNQSQMKRFKRALKKFDLEINYYVNLRSLSKESSKQKSKSRKLFPKEILYGETEIRMVSSQIHWTNHKWKGSNVHLKNLIWKIFIGSITMYCKFGKIMRIIQSKNRKLFSQRDPRGWMVSSQIHHRKNNSKK